MDDFEKYLNKQLEDPEFKKYWDEDEAEGLFMLSMSNARKSSNLTQVELSKATGIAQSNLSKIEAGIANPSFKTLKKIANATGTKLVISFVPK